jgi:hypothetical protein
MERIGGRKMDEKGYVFSPMSFLLIIPVIIIAVAYGNILNEINIVSDITLGGDVSFTTAANIIQTMEKSGADAGRNGAYNATRKVIDDNKFFAKSANGANSKEYIRNLTVASLNVQIITLCQRLEAETGREISINNIPINNYTNTTFDNNNVTITQTDPFGFYVNIKGGIPIRVAQKDREVVFYTPPISSYVSIQGLEDPYVWINTKYRTSNTIYSYPYHAHNGLAAAIPPSYGHTYSFDIAVDKQEDRLYELWYCWNGTNNPSGISPRCYYFTDPYGLSFFDRLENNTNSSTTDSKVKMSTFILGDPLNENHGTIEVSRLDHEYFSTPLIMGTEIKIGNADIADPLGVTFYLSTFYKNFFNLKSSYGN